MLEFRIQRKLHGQQKEELMRVSSYGCYDLQSKAFRGVSVFWVWGFCGVEKLFVLLRILEVTESTKWSWLY